MAIVDLLLEVREKKRSVFRQKEDWRERKVWHTTPTGQRNKIKIKNLPPEEIKKYYPSWYKKQLAQRSQPDTTQQIAPVLTPQTQSTSTGISDVKPINLNINPFILDFYYGAIDEESYNVVSADQYVIATTSAVAANKFEDEGLYVAEILGVPMGAVVAYQEDDEWINFEQMTDEEKYNEIKFGDHIWFKINLYPFLKDINFKLIVPEEEKESYMGFLDILKSKLTKSKLNENAPTQSFIDNVRKLIEGWSYEVAPMYISISGKGVFNIDVMRAIDRAYFSFVDEEGNEHEDGHARIVNHNTSGPLTYYDEKSGKQHETIVSLQIPKYAEENALEAINNAIRHFKLDAVIEPAYRTAETIQGEPEKTSHKQTHWLKSVA